MAYRYIGNKSTLLPHIVDAVKRLVSPGEIVADLMCGTASVSEALRENGYRVIASDIMTYAVHHARVRLLMDHPPTFRLLNIGDYRAVQAYLQDLPGESGLFVREYSEGGSPVDGYASRKYFTEANARQIDAIRKMLAYWETSNLITPIESSLLRHDLIMAANDVANIAGTYGHFRSKWSNSALRNLKLTPSNFLALPIDGHSVIQGRAEDIAGSISADLCYLDPPYKKRQYAANYHILETLARGDEPQTFGVSGLRDWWDQYSDFCSKRNIRKAFSDIITQIHCDRFLISYSEDGLLTMEELLALLGEFGPTKTVSIPHKRFRSNASSLGSTVTEYLVHLEVSR